MKRSIAKWSLMLLVLIAFMAVGTHWHFSKMPAWQAIAFLLVGSFAIIGVGNWFKRRFQSHNADSAK